MQSIEKKIQTIDLRKGSSPAVPRIRGHSLDVIRERILLRDSYTCQVCGRVTRRLVVDHIIPLHLGGQETDANRQALCYDCHKLKSEREEKERG